MELYLGVDGGQSSTRAAVGDAGARVLGRGQGGPCNHAGSGEGRSKLQRGLSDAVGEALKPLGLSIDETCFRRVCIGMSGGPDDKDDVIRELIRAESYDVTTDAHVALYGAVGGRPGAAVIAGTGSIALSRDERGGIHRVGGWGYVFGDEGSGFDIARKALRASLAAEEGWGPPTQLLSSLLEATSTRGANELLHRWYAGEFSRDQTAAWARLVEAAASGGDSVGLSILDAAGRALAELASSAAKSAGLARSQALVCPIGGVFQGPMLSATFATALGQLLDTTPSAPESTPETGALRAAVHGIGLDDRDQLRTAD